MTPITYLTAAISVGFLTASFIWSLSRVMRAKFHWRIVHAIIAILMIAGSAFVYMNLMAQGMLVGLALLLFSLGALLYDKSPGRWLAFVQLFAAVMLAAGVPFVTG